MRRQLFGLTLLISIIITDQTFGPPPPYSKQDFDDAFFVADREVPQIRQLEARIVKKGGIIRTNKPSPEARHQGSGGNELSKALNLEDEKFLIATKALKISKNLTNEQVNELKYYDPFYYGGQRAMQASEACSILQEVDLCDQESPYRTADGTCNHLGYYSTWGRANSCSRRYLPAAYYDGVSQIQTSVTGKPLPNARKVSTVVLTDVFHKTQEISSMVTQWGEFLGYDTSLSPMIRTAETMDIINCCAKVSKKHPACLPIEIPKNEPFYLHHGIKCLNFVRSTGCTSDCTLGPKNMVNFPTSFVDGSQVYGSNQTMQNSLRVMSGGLFRSQKINGQEYLPYSSLSQNHQCTKQRAQHQCFMAGDERVNEQPGLTSMHTIWLRQHNYLARQLKRLNSRLNDEQIFQKARRILGAMIQHITYNEFLSTILGKKITKLVGLASLSAGRTSYDPSIDPTIMTEFSTAAFRFGHSLIQNYFQKNPYGNFSLKDNFFNEQVVTSGQVASLLLGTSEFSAQKFDQYVVKAVTDHLYQVTGSKYGLDLGALNIQRGRDNGLRPYIDYLKQCTGKNVKNFNDLKNLFTKSCMEKVKQVYADVKDIDLFVGGLCETNGEKGKEDKKDNFPGILGPTFKCIIVEMFRRLKYGDRFYYENGEDYFGSIPLTDAQLKQIRKVTLSSVVCKQANIPKINKDAFFKNSKKVRCSSLPQVDVSKFISL